MKIVVSAEELKKLIATHVAKKFTKSLSYHIDEADVEFNTLVVTNDDASESEETEAVVNIGDD